MRALLVNLVLVAAGAIFWNAHHWLQWFFPISNATVGWHHTGFFQQGIYPVSYSAAYLLIGNLLLFLCSGYFAKRCDFMLGRS